MTMLGFAWEVAFGRGHARRDAPRNEVGNNSAEQIEQEIHVERYFIDCWKLHRSIDLVHAAARICVPLPSQTRRAPSFFVATIP